MSALSGRTDDSYVGEHVVYRLYDEFDEVIYIGMTHDLNMRLGHHRSGFINPWAHHIHHWTSETHPDRKAARAAERAAILEARPPFNCMHNPRKGVDADEYRARWQAKQPPPDPAAVALVDELTRMFSRQS